MKTTIALSLTWIVVLALLTGGAWAAGSEAGNENRHFDARQSFNQSFQAPANPARDQALADLRTQYPALTARIDTVFGVTRSLFNPAGYLSAASPQVPEQGALAFARRHAAVLGLIPGDLANVELTDQVYSRVSGITHLYFRQRHQGLAVWGGTLQVHLTANNEVISVGNGFVADIESAGRDAVSDLSAAEAVAAFATELGLAFDGPPEVTATLAGPDQATELSHPQISTEVIRAEMMWLPVRGGEARIVWAFNVNTPDGNHMFDVTIDATDGTQWTRIDSTASDSYRVYAAPLENPLEGGRTLEADPADPGPSPNGWHDNNLMDGNNVHAYDDQDANNSPPASQPSCGSARNCDFSINLSQDPTNYTSAAVANLFYWTNVIHDTQWKYGFDESGGNFQENNFGRGGAGSDSLNAEAQDGAGTNNANMSTPSDGGNPRMQMFLWNTTSPRRDGDLDSGIIAHEYGHGISIRQVGGPSTNCLGGTQQPGEGWSDLMALMYTAKASDAGSDARGVGGYATNSGGIRPQPYSTNSSINNVTFETLRTGVSIPHGVGWVWASIVWEAYWELVGAHGFGALGDGDQGFGNQRMMLYINEGLKFTNCGGNTVNFLDARDGIIQAATNLIGSVDVCLLWEGFASRGLGLDATTTGSLASATNGFNVPPTCSGPPPPPPPPPPPTCSNVLHSADFEGGGADGWTQGNDTCSTGSFVAGNPDGVNNGGVQTQVSGSANGTGSFFTQPNTGGAGIDDVDSGACEALSPVVSASGDVTVSFDYFHGQRDAGDDATDGFVIEILNNGTVHTVIDIDDETTNAAWTPASTTIQDVGNIQLRVRVTDGAGAGDLIEGGIDNVQICGAAGDPPPPPPPGGCTVDDDFENGAVDWFNHGASTCTTGAYVLGNPTLQNSGVTTQVGGSNSGVSSIFTATNSSAGVNDVDGGNCILGSPTWSVANATTLSVAWWHGQRDAGDDPGNDFFRLEYSVNGGACWKTLVFNGDSTSNAAWGTATAQVPAGSNLQLRVQCSDGAGPGDLVECGIDDVSICDNFAVTDAVADADWCDIPCTTDSQCNDGLFCNGVESCTNGVCQAGAPPCDDGASCTTDTCDEESDTCDYDPDDTLCDNGYFCDGVETCEIGLGCQTGQPPCDDGASCTTDTCDEESDTCGYDPDDTLCDNGYFCDGVETCEIGLGCQTGKPQCSENCNEASDDCTGSVCVVGPKVEVFTTLACLETPEIDVVRLQATGTGAITWFSDIDGHLGTGTDLTVTLSPGTHILAASVTDAEGLTRSDQISVTVLPSSDYFHIADFESGSDGWIDDGASTCTTGSFVGGTPNLTTYQLDSGAGNSSGAFFTGSNPMGDPDNGDVDGGTCEALSPTISAGIGSVVEISLDYYHGQRDTGDDGSDGMTIEVLNAGTGAVLNSMVSLGDVGHLPAWTSASTTIFNVPANIQMRVRVTDGNTGGDIVEGAFDNVEVRKPPPSCPCFEPTPTDILWRQIARTESSCLPATGWDVATLFDNVDEFPDLQGFCVYTKYPRGAPVTSADLKALDAVVECRHPTRLAIGGAQATPACEFASAIRPKMVEQFIAESGAFDRAADLWAETNVRLAILDTAPSMSMNPMCLFPVGGCSFVPTAGLSPSLHGPMLGELASAMLCGQDMPCNEPVTSRLALPYKNFDRLVAPPDFNEYVDDGYVGTICDLAKAIWNEAKAWGGTAKVEDAFKHLILNLSLTWHPDLGGLESQVVDMPLDIQAVFQAVKTVTEGGGLLIAAAGNRSDRSFTDPPALLPAAWESRAATAPPDYSSMYLPQIHAVGAVDSENRPLESALGIPALVAYGDHAIANVSRRSPLTGSSAAAIVVSAAAAAVWNQLPDLSAGDVMQLIYRSGVDLTAVGGGPLLPDISLCPRPDDPACARNTVRSVSVCGALNYARADQELILSCESEGTCPDCAGGGNNESFDPSRPSGCRGSTEDPSIACSPAQRYPGILTAEAQTVPQPSSNLCPNCVYKPDPPTQENLFIEIGDLAEDADSQSPPQEVRIEGLMLTACDNSFRRSINPPPGIELAPGASFYVDISLPNCDDAELSATVTLGVNPNSTRSLSAPILKKYEVPGENP